MIRALVLLTLIVVILISVGIFFAGADEPDSFCCVLWVGDSLRDVVTESEGGQMPSREEFDRRDGGRDQEAAEQRSPESDSAAQAPADNSTLPRAPDAGGPGRVLVPAEPGPVLSAWGFVAWLPDGRLYKPAGGLFDDPEACAQARTARQQQAPHLRLSACTLLEIGDRETL